MSRVKKFKKPASTLFLAEKKPKTRITKEVIWSIAIGVIMILSIAGAFVSDNNSGDTSSYGKFKFTYVNNQYVSKLDGKERQFVFFPAEVENIAIPDEAKNALLMSPQIIMTFKPVEDTSGIDFARFELASAFFEKGKSILEGVAGLDSRYRLPYLDCKNATAYTPVIYFEASNKTEITIKDNCIILNAETQEDFVKLKDRMLYAIYGVIQ